MPDAACARILATQPSDLQERYRAWCSLVQTHAILAIGLCIVTRDGTSRFRLHSFNVPTLQAVSGRLDERGLKLGWGDATLACLARTR